MLQHINTMFHIADMYLPEAWPLWNVTVPVWCVPYIQVQMYLPRVPDDREAIFGCQINAVKHIYHLKFFA